MSLAFDPNDPFPLLPPDTAATYADAQEHSEKVDAWLGVDAASVEAALRARPKTPGQQLWVGLDVRAMQTPYTEIRTLLARLNPRPGTTIVDLGSAYGRMGFVLGRHYPGVRFVGYEFVEERISEARRRLDPQGYAGIELRRADLSAADFSPSPAEIYFIYDYGTRQAIEKTLDDLMITANERVITVVGRGRASRDAIERRHPWLSQVFPSEHYPHYSIYRSGPLAG